jgi:hypothetical protein
VRLVRGAQPQVGERELGGGQAADVVRASRRGPAGDGLGLAGPAALVAGEIFEAQLGDAVRGERGGDGGEDLRLVGGEGEGRVQVGEPHGERRGRTGLRRARVGHLEGPG